MVRDSYCGKEIERETPYSLTWMGETHYFCSQECLVGFLEEEEKKEQKKKEKKRESSKPSKYGEIFVRGMTCASCVATVESVLHDVPYVVGAHVNFGTHTAGIQYEEGINPAQEVVQKVREAGYEVVTRRERWYGKGSIDTALADTVRGILEKVPGVLEVMYIPGENVFEVEYIQGLTDIADIEKTFFEHGFEVERESDAEEALDIHELTYRDYRRRLIIAFALSIPVHLLAHAGHFQWIPGFHVFLGKPLLAGIVMFLFSLPVEFWSGWPFLRSAWRLARHVKADMNTLIALGTLAAWTYSTAILGSAVLTGAQLSYLYFDSATAIITFILFGRTLESRARKKLTGALQGLFELQPEKTRILTDDEEKEVPTSEVKPGDMVVIKKGDRVPVDGTILQGECLVDESIITGESMPLHKEIGQPLYSGSLILEGYATIRADTAGTETLLQQMVTLVRRAQTSKSELQRIADRVSAYFVPAVLFIALVTFIGWMVFAPEGEFRQALISAVSVLIIACPCALGLATPTAVIVGIGLATKRGILVRSADMFERIMKVDTVVFDKTGTLTQGRPRLERIVPLQDFEEEKLLVYAGSLEKGSEHPIAEALMDVVHERKLVLLPVESWKSTTGWGVEGVIEGKHVAFRQPEPDILETLETQGHDIGTPVEMDVDHVPVALFIFSDALRGDALDVVHDLKHKGFHLCIISGDAESAVRSVAEKAGISCFYARLKPQEKVDMVRTFQKEGHHVLMVGDGVNDAPALAQADVGVSVRKGTAIAMESSDVVLMEDNLRRLLTVFAVAEKTVQTIKQNLFFSFLYNVLAIPLASGILLPIFQVQLTPSIAAFAMAMSSVSVVSNALFLRWRMSG